MHSLCTMNHNGKIVSKTKCKTCWVCNLFISSSTSLLLRRRDLITVFFVCAIQSIFSIFLHVKPNIFSEWDDLPLSSCQCRTQVHVCSATCRQKSQLTDELICTLRWWTQTFVGSTLCASNMRFWHSWKSSAGGRQQIWQVCDSTRRWDDFSFGDLIFYPDSVAVLRWGQGGRGPQILPRGCIFESS